MLGMMKRSCLSMIVGVGSKADAKSRSPRGLVRSWLDALRQVKGEFVFPG